MIPDISAIISVVMNIFQMMQTILLRRNHRENNVKKLPSIAFLVDILRNLLLFAERIASKLKTAKTVNPHKLLKLLRGYRCRFGNHDVWSNLERNWDDFFWLTGELPCTLYHLAEAIRPRFRRKGRKTNLSFNNQLLLTMIWLRRYPTFAHLAMHFSVSVTCVYFTLQRILPILHVYLVKKYIKWPSIQEWNNLRRSFPQFPRVVAIMDGTIVRISRPRGNLERLFYRRDKFCHFFNWIVIVSTAGKIVLSRPGFLGHLHDSTCFRHVNLPPMPPDLQIMADRGFAMRHPVLISLDSNGRKLVGEMKRSFAKCRSGIERVFGNMKSSYTIIGTKRYRGRRWNLPMICNITGAIFNRRREIFQKMRDLLD